MEHFKLGASNSHIWMKCAGMIQRADGLPETTSEAAIEGSALHLVSEACLNNNENADHYIDEIFMGKIKIDEDMAEAVQVYVDYIREVADGEPIEIEKRLDLSSLYPGMFGTGDACIYLPKQKRAFVGDAKFGMWPVEVENNSQLWFYGVGEVLSNDRPIIDVEVAIIQPRATHADGPIRSQVIPVMDLLDWSSDLKAAAIATEDPDAPLVPGDHCKWCKAAGVCGELKRHLMNQAIREFKDILKYDVFELSDSLQQVQNMKNWISSVESFAHTISNLGVDIPEHKIVNRKSNRIWSDEAPAIKKQLYKKFPFLKKETIETKSEPKLFTPPAIEKLIKAQWKGRTKDITEVRNEKVNSLAAYYHKPYTGTVLVHESDKREVVTNSAQDDFKDLIN